MTHFLFTTIKVTAGTTMRVAINTDFIVSISDIDLEQTLITLDDDTTEIAQEDFESVAARLPNQPQIIKADKEDWKSAFYWKLSAPRMTEADKRQAAIHEANAPKALTLKEYAATNPPPLRKIKDKGGRWIKNPAFGEWERARLAANP
jgi:hypothetical protein